LRLFKIYFAIIYGAFIFLLFNPCNAAAQSITVKFTVDMQYQIADGTFNSASNNVYLRGSFNSWSMSTRMTYQGNGVYTSTITLYANGYYEYKYYTDAPGFSNGGYEKSAGVVTENRWMSIGVNNIELAKIYFNNANLHIGKTTDHFVLYCADSDNQNMDRIAAYLEDNYTRLTGTLESAVGQKTNMWIYPDQKTYFVYKGYPDSPSWSVGGALGRTDVLLFSPTYMGWNTLLGTALHEFTHVVVAWKIAGTVPSWLNEGCATILSDDPPSRPIDSIRDIVNNILSGIKPGLAYIEQDSFGDGNGYPLSYSIADYIITTFGTHKLAEFLVNTDYSGLGFSYKNEFQAAWHSFLDKYYLAPQVTLKLSVDMSYYISKGWFNSSSDNVKVGGTFSGWHPYGTVNEGNGIYSFSIYSPYNMEYQYKFKISPQGAANEGWESSVHTLRVAENNFTLPLRPFNDVDDRVSILTPAGGEYFIAGDTVQIKWKFTTIPYLKIELSTNGGTNWSEIKNQVASSSYKYSWLVPNISVSDAKIKISNASDNNVNDVSGSSFRIVKTGSGGPYVKDANTMLLMHFDNNYDIANSADTRGTAYNSVSFINSGQVDLNKALFIDNTAGGSCVSVPNYPGINLTGSWTIECWFYINNCGSGNSAYPTFLFKGNYPGDYAITLNSDGKTVNADYVTTTGSVKSVSCGQLSIKTWYHLSFVRDAANKTLSLTVRNTGKEIVSSASVNDDGTPKSTNLNLMIGGVTGGSNVQFDGYIDELRISNTVREFTVGVEKDNHSAAIPQGFSLKQNYPNPFNPSTTIKFTVPNADTPYMASLQVTLKIYDLLGREIQTLVNEAKPAGTYSVRFDASLLPSGVYFYKLTAGSFSDCKKLILIK